VLVALLIRELAQAGTPFQELVDRVETYISQMQTMFVLENLENLRKNGRLTKVQSLVTGALRVKLLMAATESGDIKKLGQGLSIRQTLARMVSHMEEQASHVGRRLVIAHCNDLERAEYVRDLAKQRCQFGDIMIVPTGGISTVYANDGGIIVAY
jgi:DegV family protein with EDD domain